MAEVTASSLGSYLKKAYNSSPEDRAQIAVENKPSDGPRDAPVTQKTSAASVTVEISAAARKMNAEASADIAQDNNQFDLQTYTQQLKNQQIEQALDNTIDT
ncbi:MAG: hypothetical protein HOC45_07620 [Marinovum sp.]|nr:hypothetical protein [Marinovum sp.]MBT6506307.1 hypothetical protein [Marinovum sp.]